MKAPLAIAFLCILALAYLAWAQQQELLMLNGDVDDLRAKVRGLEPKAAPKPRAPRKRPPENVKL